jgi:iron(III) transport system permease protein
VLPAAFARTASIGYAVPGTVLAIGLLPVVTGETLVDTMPVAVGRLAGLLILGSGAALVYAYLVRFLALAVGGIEAGFSRVSPRSTSRATLGEPPPARCGACTCR